MGLQGKHTAAWFQRASGSLVNGVSSGFRYWGGQDTLVIDRGEGGHVFDMDNKRYIDFQLGFGPVILGHADPIVGAAVADAAGAGVSFAMTQRREVEAAERVKDALQWPDGLRFTNTGTEATMHATRLARGHTGRDVIVKFEGQYHGVHDYVLFSTPSSPPGQLGERRKPIPIPVGSGIPETIQPLVRTVPFNDLELLERTMAADGHRVAAVIVEPAQGNVFGIMPHPGFLEGVRKLCDDNGSLLVFDEVKTGFRLAVGGASQFFGVTPDIGTYAKAMGNGFGVAAIAMRGDVQNSWKDGGIAQAGTYSGNSVAAAAADATVTRLMTGEPLAKVEKAGRALMEGLETILKERSVESRVVGHPSMFSIYIGEGDPRDFRASAGHDSDLYDDTVFRMIKKGVMPCPDALEPWFTCAAHTDEDVATTLAVFEEALKETLAGA